MRRTGASVASVEHVDGGAPAGQRGDDGAERGRHRVLRAEREIADGDRHRQPAATEHGRRERREAADVGASSRARLAVRASGRRRSRRRGRRGGRRVDAARHGTRAPARCRRRRRRTVWAGGPRRCRPGGGAAGWSAPRRRRTAAPRRPRRRGRGRGRPSRAPNAPTSARGDVRRGRRRRRRAGGRPDAGGRAVGSAPRSQATGTPRTRRHRGPCRGRRARELGGGEGAGTEQRGARRDGRHELPGP